MAAVTLAQMQTLIGECQGYIAAENWGAAERALMQLQVAILGKPDTADRQESLRWDRNAQTIENLAKRIERRNTSRATIQRITYEQRPPTCHGQASSGVCECN